MTTGTTFVTYLWHYLVARLIYDDLLRPISRGLGGSLTWSLCALVLAALLLRATLARRRR